MELLNALSTWTYGDPDPAERLRLINARKHARQLCHWIFQYYQLVDMDGNDVDYKTVFYWPYLVQQACALLLYKASTARCNIGHRSMENCTLKAIMEAIERTVSKPKALSDLYRHSTAIDDSFAWAGPRFTIRKLESPITSGMCNHLSFIS